MTNIAIAIISPKKKKKKEEKEKEGKKEKKGIIKVIKPSLPLQMHTAILTELPLSLSLSLLISSKTSSSLTLSLSLVFTLLSHNFGGILHWQRDPSLAVPTKPYGSSLSLSLI